MAALPSKGDVEIGFGASIVVLIGRLIHLADVLLDDLNAKLTKELRVK